MKSMMTFLAPLLALSLTAAAGANPMGVQQSGLVHTAMTQSPSFEQVDANKDGAATKAEVANARALQDTRFDNADQNKDGILSKAEYDAVTKMHNQQQGG